MTQPIPTTTADLLPEGITRLPIQPHASGYHVLNDRGDSIIALITCSEYGVYVEIEPDGPYAARPDIVSAVRWTEQALAELERTDDAPVPPAPAWPKVKTTATLADALEAAAADLRAMGDVELPSYATATLTLHLMGDREEALARTVDELIVGASLPPAVDRHPGGDDDPDVHYGTPLACLGRSVHRGGLDVDVVAVVKREVLAGHLARGGAR